MLIKFQQAEEVHCEDSVQQLLLQWVALVVYPLPLQVGHLHSLLLQVSI
jgi:hypothetical protein